MDSWSLDVLDAAGGLVKNWSAACRAAATVRDEYGNSSQLKASIPVAALPQKAPVVAAQTPPPNEDKVVDAISLQLGFGQPSAMKSWKLSVFVSDPADGDDLVVLRPLAHRVCEHYLVEAHD
jgi:hypothetical protein